MARAYEMKIPGLGGKSRLYEVFLTDKPGDFTSRYSFERKADPLLAKVSQFFKLFDSALFGALVAREGPRPPLRAKAFEVIVPFDRATVTIENGFYFPEKASGSEKVVGRYSIDIAPKRKLAFEAFGSPPVDKEDPFKIGLPRFWFLGFGYDF